MNNGLRKTISVKKSNTLAPSKLGAPRNTSNINPINYRDKLSIITEDQIEEARNSMSPNGKLLRTSNTIRVISKNIMESEIPFIMEEGVENTAPTVYRSNLEEVIFTEPESKPDFQPFEYPNKPNKNGKKIKEIEDENYDPSIFSTNTENRTSRISIINDASTNLIPEKKIEIPSLNLCQVNLNTVYGTENIDSKRNYLEKQLKKEFHIKRKIKRNEMSARICLETNKILEEESNIILKKK